jgi:diguanylate cyclase (GGDEF)-like protein
MLRYLRLSARHSAVVMHERNAFIVRRAALTARLLCALTLGWICIDFLTISWPLASSLALIRFAAAFGFWLLAGYLGSGEHQITSRAVGALIGTATAFCLAANTAFWFFQSAESLFATNTYLYAPFLIAVGLSFFPLTVLECIALALPIFATMAISAALWSEFMDAISVEATLWRLAVMCVIASFSAVSQLQFLTKFTEQSARDALTRVWNRKSGQELLSAQFASAVRHRRPLSLLFLDLDQFKSINDRFGHPAGDAMLRQVAHILRTSLRRQDIVIRWGGEEFLVVLPETDCAGAETVLRTLGQAGFGLRPDGAPQTASIGVAELRQDRSSDWLALVGLADTRMYEAKRAGRNRYVSIDRSAIIVSGETNDQRDAKNIAARAA